jgi:hypothetical protein
MKDQEINDFTFTNYAGEEVKYSDVVSGKYKVTSREDLDILQATKGSNGWEAGLFTDLHRGEPGKTHESIYLSDDKKVIGSLEAVNFCKFITQGKSLKGEKIVEFGCNLARNLRIFQKQFPDCQFYGIDVNQEVIDKNREHFGDAGEFARADIFNTDFLKNFKDNEFFIGFSDAFIQCLPAGEKKQKVLHEMMRVCQFVIFSELTNPAWDPERYFSTEPGHQSGENLRRYSHQIYEIPSNCQPNQKTLYIGTFNNLTWPWSPLKLSIPPQTADVPNGNISNTRDSFLESLINSGQVNLNDL